MPQRETPLVGLCPLTQTLGRGMEVCFNDDARLLTPEPEMLILLVVYH